MKKISLGMALMAWVSVAGCAHSAAPASGGDEQEVRGVVSALLMGDAAQDPAQVEKSFFADTPAQQARVAALAESVRQMAARRKAQERLSAAAIAKFNDHSLAARVPVTLPAGNPLLQTAKVAVTGDKATLTIAAPKVGAYGGDEVFWLEKRGGKWKVSPDSPQIAKGDAAVAALTRQAQAQTEAYNAVAEEVESGKITTSAALQDALRLAQTRHLAEAKAAANPMANTGTTLWDLSASHTPADVHWPADNHSMNFSWDSQVTNSTQTLEVRLPGMQPLKAEMAQWTASDIAGKGTLSSVDFTLKEHPSAERVKALLAELGISDAMKQSMAGWPPAKASNTIYNFHQPLTDGGELIVNLLNVAKFTGVPDSWSVSMRVDWYNTKIYRDADAKPGAEAAGKSAAR